MRKRLLPLVLMLLTGLILCLYTGCVPGVVPDPDPDPDPDPTIPNRVVMVELFVAPTCPNCLEAENYMSQLLQVYGFDQLVVLEEYGWDYGEYIGWATDETKNRFKWYTEYLGISRHTPDACFNGLNQTVHYNESSYSNYKVAIDAELAKPPKVDISASCNIDIANFTVSINGNIENINTETLNNLVIGAMIYEDSVPLGSSIANHVVRDVITSEEIVSFSPGGSKEFSLISETLSNVKNMNNIHVVVYVQAQNSPTKEVLQALYVQ